MSLDPISTGQGFIASQVHAAIGALATIPARRRLAQDIEHTRELGVDPFGDAILVANIKNPESLDEPGQAGSLAITPNPPQCLREISLTTPNRDVERALRRP